MTNLQIFALNEPVEVTHTNLTRQQGAVVDLPPLANWLGVERLDTDEIEMFAVKDLGNMALSDYVALAFAPEAAIPAEVQIRLNALTGSVLLVPDGALAGPAHPGPEASHVAELPLAKADNAARLPKASPDPAPVRPAAPTEPEAAPPVALYMMIAMAVFAVLVIFVGWR